MDTTSRDAQPPVDARYDEIADHYAATSALTDDPATAALLELTGDVGGLRVLEVACGHGRVSRELARRGAQVVGIDISASLLQKAEADECREPLGITYLCADVTAPAWLPSDRFDAVVCSYGLSDIDDLEGALSTVERALGGRGWFAFSILHPCFPGWGDKRLSSWPTGTGYFEERFWIGDGPGYRGTVGSNHRTLSTYVNALAHHGLLIERLIEPAFPREWEPESPGSDEVPVFLAARCRLN